MGNSLKLAFDAPPPVGFEYVDAGFTYRVIASRPHTNMRGEQSAVITWQGLCAEDGAPFTFKTGARIYSFRRRCKDHNAGWVPAAPFGTAPKDPRSEGEIVKAFLDRWAKALDAMERDSPAAKRGNMAWDEATNRAEEEFPRAFAEDAEG